VVPADAEIHAATGSGDVEVDGIKGPANFVSGSGAITALNISGDVQAMTGSGEIKFSQVQGQVQATTGSGDITLEDVRNQVRLHSGSGNMEITNPADAVEASTEAEILRSRARPRIYGYGRVRATWLLRQSRGLELLGHSHEFWRCGAASFAIRELSPDGAFEFGRY